VGKLSQKDRNGLIRRYKAGEKVTALANRYQVTRRIVYKIIDEYERTGMVPIDKKPGRKKTQLSQKEKEIILECSNECDLGANGLEVYIKKNRGIHIPHNKIHSLLLSQGIAKESIRKKRQRKYCRYQRKHSMSLWHTDWKEVMINGERKYVTAFIDDRSRYVTCFGIFDNQTTEYTIEVLERGIEEYGVPNQIVTDNGSQFCSPRNGLPENHDFEKFLIEHGIKHIRSRVSHPQTNGKIERFFKEVEERIDKFGSLEAIVEWQNKIKPHRSLYGLTPEEVFWNALPPERVLNYVCSWFWDLNTS